MPFGQIVSGMVDPQTVESTIRTGFQYCGELDTVTPHFGSLGVLIYKWAKGCKHLGRGPIPQKVLFAYLAV